MKWEMILIAVGTAVLGYIVMKFISLCFENEIERKKELLEKQIMASKERILEVETNASERIAEAYQIQERAAELRYSDRMMHVELKRQQLNDIETELSEQREQQRIQATQDRLRADTAIFKAESQLEQMNTQYQSILKAFNRKKSELDAIKLYLEHMNWEIDGKRLTKNRLTSMAKKYMNSQKESQ